MRTHSGKRWACRHAAVNVPEEAPGSAGSAASTAAAAAAAASGAVPSTALSTGSMLQRSAGAGDAASAMVRAGECSACRNLATRLNVVQPKETARMDLNKHEHGRHSSSINKLPC